MGTADSIDAKCRDRVRPPGPEERLAAVMAEVEQAREEAERIAVSTQDDRIARPAATAAEILAASLSTAATLTPQTDRLRVALMGRSKAGKTNLIAALAGDREAAGVGVGRQRTTREPRTTRVEGFDLIDLPGVGALDGEQDTAVARRVAANADAVVWLYAESLQQGEADELEDLLRKGKPVVVAYNAKSKVDSPVRRRIFVQAPVRAFRDLDSHRERVAQIADRAGTHAPPFVAVQARAAWWGMRDGDAGLSAASRVDELLEACHTVLTSRTEVLQLRARHDRPRVKLVELAGAARATADMLTAARRSLEKRINSEAVSLRRELTVIRADASALLDAVHAKTDRQLRRWVRKHRKEDSASLNAEWVRFLREAGFDEVAHRYETTIDRQLERSRARFVRAAGVERKLTRRRSLAGSEDYRFKGRLRSAARAMGRGVLSMVRSYGLERGVAVLIARLTGKATPAGWVLIAVDAAKGMSEGVRAELGQRRLRSEQWSADALATCRADLQAARELVAARLDRADAKMQSRIQAHQREAIAGLHASIELRRALKDVAHRADDAVAQGDRELVQELLRHSGLRDRVRSVDRVPSKRSTVTFDVIGWHQDSVAVLEEHLAPEHVRASHHRHLPSKRKAQQA